MKIIFRKGKNIMLEVLREFWKRDKRLRKRQTRGRKKRNNKKFC